MKFNAGDIVKRKAETVIGTHGRSVLGEEVVVLEAIDKYIKIFEKETSPCWQSINFVLVKEAKDYKFQHGDVVRRNENTESCNGVRAGECYTVDRWDDSVHIRVKEVSGMGGVSSKRFTLIARAGSEQIGRNGNVETPISEDLITDIDFKSLNSRQKKSVVLGKNWICSNCSSHFLTSDGAKRCCRRNEVKYVYPVSHLWYSSTKDELVEIEHMIPIHLRNAITKLRKEGKRNSQHYLLNVLEAEADRRSLEI